MESTSLNGSVAIVTGASRGIGLGVAKQLIAEGARVGITARKADELERAVAELGGPDHAIGLAGNATDTAHQIEAIEQVTETFGPVDILVNNTGGPPPGLAHEADVNAFSTAFRLHLLAYQTMVLALVPGMTDTPLFAASQPVMGRARSFMQTPEDVVAGALVALGKQPVYISSASDRMAANVLGALLPRRREAA